MADERELGWNLTATHRAIKRAPSLARLSGHYGSQTLLHQVAGKQTAAAGPAGGSRKI